MPDTDADLIRRELHTLVDHIPEREVASARDYLRSLVDPVERALLDAPTDDEPMSEHERTSWELDEHRLRRGESPISGEGFEAEPFRFVQYLDALSRLLTRQFLSSTKKPADAER